MDKIRSITGSIYQGKGGGLYLHVDQFKTTIPMTQQMIMELNINQSLQDLQDFNQNEYDMAYGYAPRPELTPLQKEVEGILAQIQPQIDKYGYFSVSTCDENSYGWSKLKHSAMEYIQRNPPQGMHVSRAVKFEVTDWKITNK